MLWTQRRRGVGLRADRSGAAGLARRIALAARRRMTRVGELLAQVCAVREAVDSLRAASRRDGNRRLARRGVKRPRPPGHTPFATLRARVVGATDTAFGGGPGLGAAAAVAADRTVRGDARLDAIPSRARDRARRDDIGGLGILAGLAACRTLASRTNYTCNLYFRVRVARGYVTRREGKGVSRTARSCRRCDLH